LKAIFNDIVHLVQNSARIQAGILIMMFGVTVALDAAAEFGVIQGGLKNGCTEVSREGIMHALLKTGKFGDIRVFSHALLHHSLYISMGSGMHLTSAPFRINKGVHKGTVESSWFFAIACNKAFQKQST